MCNVGLVALGATAVGGAMSVYGQRQQAKATEQANLFNARVAERNAQTAEENVRQAQLAGAEKERSQRIKIQQMIGLQRANLGASGLDIDYGTGVDVQASTAGMGQEDLLRIRNQTQAQERAFRQKGADFTNQANMSKAQAENAITAGNIGAWSTVFQTAGSSALTAYQTNAFGGSGAGTKSVTYETNPWLNPDTGVYQ